MSDTSNAGSKQVKPKGQFPNKATQFKPGQSGNPEGMKPGTKHLSTWIKELMNDPEFEVFLHHPTQGYIVAPDGPPIKAIVRTAVYKAAAGDDKSREWLAKYGWGTKFEISGPDEGPVQAIVQFVDAKRTNRRTK